jgi:hypothetical protein
MVYISDEEMKNNEFIILRNNICRSSKDINKVLELEFSRDKINKKKDEKVDKKIPKVPGNKYNYGF